MPHDPDRQVGIEPMHAHADDEVPTDGAPRKTACVSSSRTTSTATARTRSPPGSAVHTMGRPPSYQTAASGT